LGACIQVLLPYCITYDYYYLHSGDLRSGTIVQEKGERKWEKDGWRREGAGLGLLHLSFCIVYRTGTSSPEVSFFIFLPAGRRSRPLHSLHSSISFVSLRRE